MPILWGVYAKPGTHSMSMLCLGGPWVSCMGRFEFCEWAFASPMGGTTFTRTPVGTGRGQWQWQGGTGRVSPDGGRPQSWQGH